MPPSKELQDSWTAELDAAHEANRKPYYPSFLTGNFITAGDQPAAPEEAPSFDPVGEVITPDISPEASAGVASRTRDAMDRMLSITFD